jgi:hypothetical protein
MSPNQTPNNGRGLKVLSIFLILIGAIVYGIAGGVDGGLGSILGAAILILGFVVHFKGRKQAANAANFALDSSGGLVTGKHVLYLRSFRTDVATSVQALASGLSSEEEQLAGVLRPFGQMIAIGKPGEPLPLPGAARIYATSDEWKGIVLERMRAAPLVVIRASTRRGLLWEVEQAIHTLPPHKIVFFIMNMTMSDYHKFTARVHADLAINLPQIPSFGVFQAMIDLRQNPSKAQSGFLYFPSGWIPAFLPIPATIVRLGYNDLRESMNTALRPVFELNGIPWRPLGRFQS